MKRLKLGFFLTLIHATLFSQTFQMEKLDLRSPDINTQISDYDVYNLDLSSLSKTLDTNNGSDISLVSDNFSLAMQLVPNDILGEDFQIKALKSTGVERIPYNAQNTYIGYLADDPSKSFRFYISDKKIQGRFLFKGKTYRIESYSNYEKTAEQNTVLVYNVEDRLDKEDTGWCEHIQEGGGHEEVKDGNKDAEASGRSMACVSLGVSIAMDYLMFVDQGESLEATMEFAVTVLNDVEGDYATQFNDQIEFYISELLVSCCEDCDPWSSTINIFDFYQSFRDWALYDTGFDNAYDFASIWTDRVFDTGAVGVASTNGVCNLNRFNALRKFSNNPDLLRVMHAHEIGHGLGANHNFSPGGDCSPPPRDRLIMDPVVNATAMAWSTGEEVCAINNVENVNEKLATSDCFTACGSNPCDVVMDIEVTEVYSNYAHVKWEGTSGEYRVMLREEDSELLISDIVIAESSYVTFDESELEALMSYVVSVKSVCGNDESDYKSAIFRTPDSELNLPIELLDFTAIEKGEEVLLEWVTASEINNDYFQILRSANARDYEEIAKVSSYGNSSLEQSYTFTDVEPQLGTNYYKLVQHDFDGQYEEFHAIVVNIKPSEREFTLKVNSQTESQIALRVSNGIESSVDLLIYDTSGKIISNSRGSVNETYTIDTSNLTAGIYIAAARSQEGFKTIKFLKH